MKSDTLKRVEKAESALNAQNNQAIYRCFMSDGREETLTIMEALISCRCYEEVDGEFLPVEPYIVRCELVEGRDRQPHLCDILEQLVESNTKKERRRNEKQSKGCHKGV